MKEQNTLDYLFDLDFTDLEQEVYIQQKQSLLKGIKFSPVNGVLINYVKSNQLIQNDNKASEYLLHHAFYVNTFPSLRGKLSKLVIFPEEEFLITVIHNEIPVQEVMHCFKDDKNLKVNLNHLYSLLHTQYELKDLILEVKLIKMSPLRMAAELNDNIFDSYKEVLKIHSNFSNKMEVLLILNKPQVLKERIKLWGFENYTKELIESLSPLNLKIKDLYWLSTIDYHFLNHVSNEDLFTMNTIDESYIRKVKTLLNQLKNHDVLWVSN